MSNKPSGGAGLRHDCRPRAGASDCGPPPQAARVTEFTYPALTALSALVLAVVLVLIWRARRVHPRERALTRLLDAADALEARLRTARAEIEQVTGTEDDSVRTALQEMLRQRLWLQQHGDSASIRQIDDIRISIEQAQARIDQQLERIAQARLPR